MFLPRFVQAIFGFLLGTMGATTPVAAALICFAVLLFGPGVVLDLLAVAAPARSL